MKNKLGKNFTNEFNTDIRGVRIYPKSLSAQVAVNLNRLKMIVI